MNKAKGEMHVNSSEMYQQQSPTKENFHYKQEERHETIPTYAPRKQQSDQ
jgi:hypothetical protein